MIRLSVVSYNNMAPVNSLSAVFGPSSKTVGRGDDNHLILPDPKQLVSRVQASIKSDGSRHTIINLSKGTSILVNGKPVESERESTLQVGDEIQMGLYVLRAEAHLSAVGGAQESVASAPPKTLTAADDTATQGRAPIAQLTLELGVGEMPMVSPAKVAGTKVRPIEAIPAQPADLGASREAPHQVATARENDIAEPDADDAALIQAFLKGAGIPAHTPPPNLTPEFMETVGKLLATSIQGMVELSALRTFVKREVNADVTMVVVRNNNPIKFFRDAETVLTQMFRKKMPGFMGPEEAIEDAFQDLRAHQLGVVAGLRAAMAHTLARIHPERLEKKLEAPSWVDSMFPNGRKGKLWDLYAERFKKINQESQDEFQGLFGDVFVKAYEHEAERVRNGLENPK